MAGQVYFLLEGSSAAIEGAGVLREAVGPVLVVADFDASCRGKLALVDVALKLARQVAVGDVAAGAIAAGESLARTVRAEPGDGGAVIGVTVISKLSSVGQKKISIRHRTVRN